MRTLLLSVLAALSVLGVTGCTLPLIDATTRYVPLGNGVRRAEIVKTLGPPQQTRSFTPAAVGSTFTNAPSDLRQARVSIYDEYRLNGLVQSSQYRPYAGYGEGYTMGMYLTLGLGELIYLPVTAIDLAARRTQHFQLRLWYDGAGKLIAADHRRESAH